MLFSLSRRAWLSAIAAGRGRPACSSKDPGPTRSRLAKRARSLNPLSVDAVIAQANGEWLRRDYNEALGLFQKATELQPENAEAWYALGEFDLRHAQVPGRRCRSSTAPSTPAQPACDPGNKESTPTGRSGSVNSGKAVC